MPKAYIITAYRAIFDAERLAAYIELSRPAIEAAGGRFLARGGRVTALEQGLAERTVLVEFDSVEAALAAYRSPAYTAALDVLGNAAERDVRVVEGF